MTTPTPLETLRAAASAAQNRDPLANSAKADPSDRDLQIFKLVTIEHFTHAQAAKRFGITRGRVTQIIKQVRATLAEATPSDPEINDHLARQRLETHLERERLQHVLAISARALRAPPKPLCTTRAGQKTKAGEKEEWTETITKEQPLNLQLLKTYLRATEALGKLSHVGWDKRGCLGLAQHDPAQRINPDQQNLTQEELFHAVQAVLLDWQRGLDKEPNRPNHAFIALVKHFQWCLFSWLYHRRQGSPASQIVLPPFPQPDSGSAANCPLTTDNCPSSTDNCRPPPANPSPNPANHPFPETNLDLTSDPSADFDASPYSDTLSDVPDSSPFDHDPVAPLPKKSAKVSATSPHLQNRGTRDSGSSEIQNLFARRLAHERKLEQFREANRRGLPCMIEFDPADGPLPELSGHLDDYGYQPTPPNKEDEAQMVKDYLAKLRAESRANA